MYLLIRYFWRTFFLVVALSVLVACGNKGPLYLSDKKEPPVSMTPTTPPAAVTTQDEDEPE